MGMLDSLGNLGGLGQITKALDPGNWIKQGLNSVLPKNMHVLGDAAGALFDLKTGNLLGAAQLGMEAMKDLPQATKSQTDQAKQGAANNATAANANPGLEPSPPPAASKPIDTNKLMDILNKLFEMLSGKKNTTDTNTGGVVGQAQREVAAFAKEHASSGNGARGTSTTTTTTTTHERTSGWSGSPVDVGATAARAAGAAWVGEPRTPATTTRAVSAPATGTPAPTTSAAPPATAAPAPATTPSAPAASAPAASAAAAGSTAPANGETISSIGQLNGMSDSAIRDAVIHGRISPELAKDQTAMMAIQQRMNAISEMNNLMTNMMRALHDMQMAVVQNIRI